mmetsp:Transcript_8161/g.21424  ORF Transcript_8161/g.21424 Transcript_8161/m.21424 type:complete len:196 (-) Transcript_8161:1807-2394(-)
MDVTSESSVAAAAAATREVGGGRVDLVINCAGLLHEAPARMPERNLGQVDVEWARKSFEVNALGPLMVVKHFSPMMVTDRKEGRVFSVLATISARVGSIGDNRLGGWHSYRISKAAQNQMTKTSSVELRRRGTAVIALHPGTVNTELSEPFQKGVKPEKLFDVDYSAKMLLGVINSVTMEDTGKFFAYDRQEVPW